ncbi:MAG: low molecular weight phosphatase family protein [Nanoarchaeota archaeon]|nr:low molecular weight phosphatase family protein [Nanoarchaeota archaeon]MBU1028253.1 low molecular weight phosphatase family protein [Nanoarchaeota archaeon]
MKVLFVFKDNVGRSQMAEGFFNYYFPDHCAKSAGTKGRDWSDKVLGEELAWDVVRCMLEKGINLNGKRPKQLDKKLSQEADKIIWIEDILAVPYYIGKSKINYWNVMDPRYSDYEGHCKVRDHINFLVKRLIDSLNNSKQL